MQPYQVSLISTMDKHILESENPTIEEADYMRMVSRHLKAKMDQTWRVKYFNDGTASVYSFAMPPQKNLPNADRLNAAEIPDWIKERVSVLQICEVGSTIEDVGQKVSEAVYYVIE